MHTQPNLTQAKKTWAHPELILIASNTIEAKIHPSVREGTGHIRVTGGKTSFVNPAGKGFLLSTSTGGGAHSPHGHKSSAAS